MLQTHQVRVGQVRILVRFVRVVNAYPPFRGEGELRDDVMDVEFLLRLLRAQCLSVQCRQLMRRERPSFLESREQSFVRPLVNRCSLIALHRCFHQSSFTRSLARLNFAD